MLSFYHICLLTAYIFSASNAFYVSHHRCQYGYSSGICIQRLSAFRGAEVSPSPRIKKIKDLYTTKEIMNDLTASEFALIVNMKTKEATIDYEKLITQLERDISILSRRNNEGDANLITRIQELNENLFNKLRNKEIPETAREVVPITDPAIEKDEVSDKEKIPSLRIVVREDGTIDWEDAIASSREVAKFGTEVCVAGTRTHPPPLLTSLLSSPLSLAVGTTQWQGRAGGHAVFLRIVRSCAGKNPPHG